MGILRRFPSPDTDTGGKLVFSPRGGFFAVKVGATLVVRDARTGETRIETTADDWAYAFSPDETMLVTGSPVSLELWDLRSFTQARTLTKPTPARPRALRFDGKRLVMLTAPKAMAPDPAAKDEIFVWDDALDGSEPRRLSCPPPNYTPAVAFDVAGDLALVGSGPKVVRVDLATGAKRVLYTFEQEQVRQVVLASDATTFLASGDTAMANSSAVWWQIVPLQELERMTAPKTFLAGLSFSSDGRPLTFRVPRTGLEVIDLAHPEAPVARFPSVRSLWNLDAPPGLGQLALYSPTNQRTQVMVGVFDGDPALQALEKARGFMPATLSAPPLKLEITGLHIEDGTLWGMLDLVLLDSRDTVLDSQSGAVPLVSLAALDDPARVVAFLQSSLNTAATKLPATKKPKAPRLDTLFEP